MGQRKEYNPNTQYGRQKIREQARQNYESLPPDEKVQYGCIYFVIILVIIIIAFLLLGPEAALKWMSH